ncbi:Uncharacterized protein FWK35_00030520, partial [Aphis craccivora]
MRKKAANDFEKDFFKLLNNAVFGKIMESMRKIIKMELVSSDSRLQKLINQSTFKHCTTYNKTLNAVALENKIIDFCKPIYIGFAVLEISKEKIPGLFSDETDGRIMREFCALRAKSYSYILEDKEKIKSKGIRGHVVRNHMTFQDHKRCLFGDASLEVTTSNVSIRSFKHKLKTIKSNKLTYNSFNDKRVILEDNVHTLAHGHYSIE